ncbi:AAA family ATPase [Mycobacterium sp. URHB0044]|uniref:AAA family ATPase n=1 Tax=Mycobacterium sp. URHB0044 TaxID=1380386 RepID=UPI000491654C|nr:AAA family ATPase [Mycobacterium sp. URHB0044]
MASDAVIRELAAAVERSPDAIELRLHLADLLIQQGSHAEALMHCSAALSHDATNPTALSLLQQCSAGLSAAHSQPDASVAPSAAGPKSEFNWSAAEEEVSDIIGPAFVDGVADVPASEDDTDFDVIGRSTVKLADVAGMVDVKQRLEVSLLGPIRNPELMKAYKVTARGGLLLYGPPGCGKTYLARAVAGELGANFYPVGIADVLQHWLGDSERALNRIFETARRNAPCVLFFDEVDALGQRRAALSNSSGLRVVVNALLAELDTATSSNDGVYVLGATNMPWDVDPALRRPGRFDRMIFVGLPDTEARASIVRMNLRDRPIERIDPIAVAKRTDGFSGADVAHVCDTATQLAMADSLRTGQVRPVRMDDVHAALAQIRPSAGPWFDTARNVVEFANGDGTYDELANYLRRKKTR